ncbi:unnamed protein product [Scytosiphon promiscuus]
MDFAALRSAKRGESDYGRDSAAEIVSNANPSALVDNLSGRVAKVARDAAATVVALMRNASGVKENKQREDAESGQINLWHVFNAGLLEVQANLARNAIRSQVFQDELLLALHREEFGHPETEAGTGESQRWPRKAGRDERRGERQAVPLALYWRLHESGLLPLSRLLEATEALLSPLTGGQECGVEGERRIFGGPLDAIVHDIVRDMRYLAVQSARKEAYSNEGGSAHVLSGVAKHLFDLAYRKCAVGSEKPTATSRAARTILDQLCCGPQVFGQDRGTETRLRGCLSVVSAILPMAASVISTESGSAAEVIAAGRTVRDDGASSTGSSSNGYDGPTAAFLSRQLRLLMESSSGQSEHTQGKGVAGPADGNEGHLELLVEILRYFPSGEVIEVLRSICRRAAVTAADRTGFSLHKPLLSWDTLGPIVRAAATAFPQDVPSAVALTGTEMAAAAVNFIPSGDGNTSRTKGCNQQQGVLVLSAALRLVAEADVCSQRIQSGGVEGEGGLYAAWARSCFGTDDRIANVVGSADDIHPQQGHGQETQMRDLRPRPAGSELQLGMREAMEKQRATEILMEALCLSVPYDPAFVLEVHRDVLKTRLRAKFSVQVRDLVDLVATRLSDLKTRDDAYRPRGVEEGHHYHYASGVENPSERESGGCSDPITREVGFFLRQFKQTGVVPLALKTAILWQPKSWASFRKVLLAPPAERIALPDDSGTTRPASRVVVKEAIGRGENGLRVEVSLKYRRLLVQKLAKESLLSAKDHETFRLSYVEYLQDQRDEDGAERHGEDEPEAVTAVARRLLMLESKLGQIEKGKGPSTAEKRLALLLQEYLPRALVVELCMENDGEARCRSPSPAYLKHGRDWFSRASSLLQQILGEWKQSFHPIQDLPGCGASPEQVAEAVLNSVHCCVAAVAASLLSPSQSSLVSSASSSSDSCRRGPGCDDTEGDKVSHPEASSGVKKMLTLLDLPVARAFQRVGQVVTLTTEIDLLGEALFRRCSNLLANPTNLDPKQILSLAHSLAGFSPAFHGKVATFLASLVEEVLSCPSPTDEGGRTKSPTDQMAKLAGTAQIGALYLQSSLLLQEHVWERAVEHSVDRSRACKEGDAEDDSRCRETQNRIGIESVGLAPVVMLEFCWWMERRLSLAQHLMTAERRNDGMTGLLRLLREVLKHPLIERALSSVWCARGSTVPSLERLVSFEMAISSENAFGGASVKLLVLESVTLDRVAVVSTKCAEGRRNNSSTDQGASAQPINRRAVGSVNEVWKECTACLFGNASLRDAACRRVRRGAPIDGCIAGVEEIVCDWESRSHPAWREADADGRLTHGLAEGVDGLLDSILQIMGKLCNLEAAAGSACGKDIGNENFDEARDPRELETGGQRRASVLLAESLTLLTRSRIDGSGPALVLIAEITVMAIGATEGRGKAIDSLRLLLEGWFCNMRPLEVGAIERLMRIALLWHGGRSDAKHGSGNLEDDPMTRTLENLPILGAEMARTWTRLGRTLQPVIGPHRTSAGPFVREGWACQIDCLHSAGKKILLYLAERGIAAEDTPSSTTRPVTNNSDRVPLGTVKNSIPYQKGRVYPQHRDQSCAAKDAQSGKAPRDRSREEASVRPCCDPLRGAFTALPHTSAQVVIGVLQAVAEMRTKGSREVSATEGDAKRVKVMAGEPTKLEGFGSTEILEGTLPEGIGGCDEASNRSWATHVLEPIFGSNPAGPAASSLRVLLETVILEMGYRRTSTGISIAGRAGGVRAEVCKSLELSLAVAILGHAPPLVASMGEPPCLTDSSSSLSPIERLERSLAVLDVLRMFSAVRPCLKQLKGWIVVLLSHYSAALLIFASEHLTGALLSRRGWPDVVAFVHARVRGVARTDLQAELPVALRLAAQEIDPLLKQYL